MATLVEVNGVGPTIGADVWLAPTAVLIGDVRVGDRANIWFGAVLRADFDYIEVGEESAIQDNAVLHVARGLPTIVGRRVTVAHGALVEGCVIEDGALIGMGAIVLHHARVGAGTMLAAGAVARTSPSSGWPPAPSTAWAPRRAAMPGPRVAGIRCSCCRKASA
jgi:carbonic anhydrase/acetyltransferase-like protein (isoleucine patch superfamily)